MLFGPEPLFPEEPEPPPPGPPPPWLKPVLPVGRAIRDWWRELLVNSLASLVWFGLSITIIGGPPAAAALYVTARAAILHESPDWRLFLAALRTYFMRAWVLALVGLVGIVIWFVDLQFYLGALGGQGVLGWAGAIFVIYVGVVWLQVLLYAWPIMVCRDDLRLPQLLRNGFIIALRFPFASFINSLFLALLLLASWYLPPLFVLVLPPIVALLGLHSLYLLVPELVPEDSQALSVVG
jgi:hypothetical protein